MLQKTFSLHDLLSKGLLPANIKRRIKRASCGILDALPGLFDGAEVVGDFCRASLHRIGVSIGQQLGSADGIALLLERNDLRVNGSSQKVVLVVQLFCRSNWVFGDLDEFGNGGIDRFACGVLHGSCSFSDSPKAFAGDYSATSQFCERCGCIAGCAVRCSNLLCQIGQLVGGRTSGIAGEDQSLVVLVSLLATLVVAINESANDCGNCRHRRDHSHDAHGRTGNSGWKRSVCLLSVLGSLCRSVRALSQARQALARLTRTFSRVFRTRGNTRQRLTEHCRARTARKQQAELVLKHVHRRANAAEGILDLPALLDQHHQRVLTTGQTGKDVGELRGELTQCLLGLLGTNAGFRQPVVEVAQLTPGFLDIGRVSLELVGIDVSGL